MSFTGASWISRTAREQLCCSKVPAVRATSHRTVQAQIGAPGLEDALEISCGVWHEFLDRIGKAARDRLESSIARRLSAFAFALDNDAHSDARDASNNLGLRRVVEPAHFLMRMRMRNHDQLSPVNLAPAAHIAISQFCKVDRPLELGCPGCRADFPFLGVDLHQRSRPNQGIQSEILQTDIAVYRFAQIQVLQQSDRHFIPFFDDSSQQTSFLEAKAVLQFNRKRYLVGFILTFRIDQMCSGQPNASAVAPQVPDLDTEVRSDFRKSK